MRKYLKILVLIFVVICFSLSIFSEEDIKLKKLSYDVDVVGNFVNFRVYYKGKLVKNLKKKDFKLFINGKKIKIEYFDENKKKINVKVDDTKNNRRFFVLIFNISDYRLDMKDNLIFFFEKILKRGDRLIFVSNNFYLNDRIVLDPTKEKEKIFKLLEQEKKRIRVKLVRLRNTLYSLLNDTLGMLQSGQDVRIVRRFFIDSYMKYLREFKNNYLDLDTSQYIELTRYLSNLKMDKWILSFYHIGGFYRPGKQMEILLQGDPGYTELLEQLDIVDKIPGKDLSKYFLRSGATVYSIFMKNSEFAEINLFNGSSIISPQDSDSSQGSFEINNLSLEYKKIASHSEKYFSLASKISGGKVFSSRKTDKFFKTITQREDIMYSIYFSALKKDKVFKLVPNNKKYKVLYDNQKKSHYFKLLKKEDDIIDVPQINIDNINVKKEYLILSIVNYKTIESSKKFVGNIELKIKVLKSNKIVFNKKKSFKTYLVKTDLRIRLPIFKKGKYSIFVETKDLNTKRNDIIVYDYNKVK